MRPRCVLSPARWGFGEQLEVVNAYCPMPNRSADAIVSGVTTADDDDVLAAGVDGRFAVGVAGRAPCCIHCARVEDCLGVRMQELHGQVNPFQCPTWHLLHVAPNRCASGKQHRIIVLDQVLRAWAALLAHSPGLATDENNAFLLHDLCPPLHDIDLVGLHVWHAVHHQATWAIRALIHSHQMAHLVQLVCRSEPGWSRANNRNVPACPHGWRAWFHPPHLVGFVDDEELHRLDGNRFIDDAKHARCFAWRRTHTPREFWEVVG
mmetsp:Transcript_20937/g.33399  ORF Transcript_20937/g.33399 Transcript_20937/m.33399 type:complete len:264 (-) Transcript_20937:1265-2056(-)